MNQRIAIIPSFEPEPVLLHILEELSAAGMEILLADDGSGPQYASIFQKAEQYARVISYPENHGKGYALKQAFSFLGEQPGIKEHPWEATVVVLDSDGQHRVADAVRLCEAAEEHRESLCLGSRRQSVSSPMRSRVGNAITRWVYRLTAGKQVYDTQTGLRAFCAQLLPDLLKIPGDRYEYEMNVLMYFAEWNIPIREIPIETIYINENAGSHFHAVKDSWRIYKEILKFSASSFLGFLVDYSLYSLILTAAGTGYLLQANVIARIISGSVNFTVNRRYVFRDTEVLWKSALKYTMLAIGILLFNSIILYSLTIGLGVNAYLAKIGTELTLFLASWLIQRNVVFLRSDRSREKGRWAK